MGELLTVKEFLDSVKEGKLKGVKCLNCGHAQIDIVVFCPKCGKSELKVVDFGTTGKVLTYTIQHVAPEPFLMEVPYAWAVIELEDGVRVTGWIPSVRTTDELQIGQRVKLSKSYKPGLVFEKM